MVMMQHPSCQRQHCEFLYPTSGAGLPLRPSMMAHWGSGMEAGFVGTLGETGLALAMDSALSWF